MAKKKVRRLHLNPTYGLSKPAFYPQVFATQGLVLTE